MNKLELVLAALKPKIASLGFNEEEVKNVATSIVSGLAEDEPTAGEVNARIDAVIPILKVSQSMASRVINKAKEPIPNPKTKGVEEPNFEDEPAWFKKYREDSERRILMLETDKVSSLRRSQLESLLKDSGTFGKTALKSFEKMSFADEEEFAQYLTETKSDFEAFTKEMSEKGLNINPIEGSQKGGTEETINSFKVISETTTK